jgi:hypothetical protein
VWIRKMFSRRVFFQIQIRFRNNNVFFYYRYLSTFLHVILNTIFKGPRFPDKMIFFQNTYQLFYMCFWTIFFKGVDIQKNFFFIYLSTVLHVLNNIF